MNTRTLLILGIFILLIAVLYIKGLGAAALTASLLANLFALEKHVDRKVDKRAPSTADLPTREFIADVDSRANHTMPAAADTAYDKMYTESMRGGARLTIDDMSAEMSSRRALSSGVNALVERGANILPESRRAYYEADMEESEQKQWWGEYDN